MISVAKIKDRQVYILHILYFYKVLFDFIRLMMIQLKPFNTAGLFIYPLKI